MLKTFKNALMISIYTVAVLLSCFVFFLELKQFDDSHRIASASAAITGDGLMAAKAADPSVNAKSDGAVAGATDFKANAAMNHDTVPMARLRSEPILNTGNGLVAPPPPPSPGTSPPPVTPDTAVVEPEPTDIDHGRRIDGCVYGVPIHEPVRQGQVQGQAQGYYLQDESDHIVPPPAGPVTLVCCNTTKGRVSIAVHPTWAPNGARRFLEMVNTGFFDLPVGLFRSLNMFLVQFGLHGDPEVQKAWHRKGHLKDDPNWLPLGPPGREAADRPGVFRYQRGYMAYAGAGNNSRGTQLILAYQKNKYLGGGSPWEIPFGQVVGAASFIATDSFYTKYGEKVSQGKIMNRGNEYLKENFPELDYISGCMVVQRGVQWRRKGEDVEAT